MRHRVYEIDLKKTRESVDSPHNSFIAQLIAGRNPEVVIVLNVLNNERKIIK